LSAPAIIATEASSGRARVAFSFDAIPAESTPVHVTSADGSATPAPTGWRTDKPAF
jgi:hypothetical protein